MKLNSLIDFLPYAYKDLDSYKVDGKGLLERFLEIFGDYFQDIVTQDTDRLKVLDDLDETPAYFLNYLWEFLGELPFATTPILSQEVWDTYFAGFKDDATIEQLCNKWLNNRNGVLEFDTDTVRKLLKCSIALFKIRGTKEFFEILFRLYGLNISISDPVGTDTNLWIPDLHPLYDDPDMVYDKDITYDNLYRCTQCVAVPITISGHGFTSASEEFLSFKRSIDALFERFLPYNARPEIDYGVTLNYNYKITAVPQITPTLIQGEVDEIPILVTVTANKEYGEVDLRYQVSGDGVTWSTIKYDSPSIYYGKRKGTIYFRAVGDESKVATVTIGKEVYLKNYNIWGTWSDGSNVVNGEVKEIPEGEKSIKITINGSVSFKGNNIENIPIRRKDNDEVKNGPAEWEFDEFGEYTYTFSLVDFPTKSLTVTIKKIQEYKVTCEPAMVTVSSIDQAGTVVRIETKYPHNDDSPFEAVEINAPSIIVEQDNTFKPIDFLYGYGSYVFRCTEDDSGNKENYGTFQVIMVNSQVIHPYNITFLDTLPSQEFTGSVTKTINIKTNLRVDTYHSNEEYYASLLDAYPIYIFKNQVPVDQITAGWNVGTGDYMEINGTYTISEVGTYSAEFADRLPSVTDGSHIKSPYYKFTTKASAPLLYIKAANKNDPNWVFNDPDYPTQATYTLNNEHECIFNLEFNQPDYNGILVELDWDHKTYVTGAESDYTLTWTKDTMKQGTYTFTTVPDSRLDTPQSVSITLVKEPPAYQIWCEPTSWQLSEADSWASTTVYLTMEPEDTSGEFTYDVYLNGTQIYHDAKPENGGWIFQTQTTGTYTFVCKDDPSKTCTFTVEGLFSVSPAELIWEAEETQSKEISITINAVGEWTATLNE